MINSMKFFRSIVWAAFMASIGFALLPSLQADTWNKKTTLTVTEPLQVPSCCTPGHTVTLQPGEYVMVLVDSLSDRHIVRIFDKDQQHVITTILAIPNYRLQPTGETVFQYWEVPAGQPRALRAWFYPGDNFGQEFAYPKQKAAQIAAFVKIPVPAIEVETSCGRGSEDSAARGSGRKRQDDRIDGTRCPARAPDAALQPALQAQPVQPSEPLRPKHPCRRRRCLIPPAPCRCSAWPDWCRWPYSPPLNFAPGAAGLVRSKVRCLQFAVVFSKADHGAGGVTVLRDILILGLAIARAGRTGTGRGG